jgi:hypothetical protein
VHRSGGHAGILRGKAGDRKLRLFIAACCRRISHLLPQNLLRDPKGREAVEVAERWADNPSEAGEFSAAFDAVLIAAQ